MITMLLWFAACAASGYSAYANANAAKDTSRELALISSVDQLSEADLDEVAASLRSAQADFSTAESDLGSLAILPLRWLPIVGTQLTSANSLASSGAAVTESAADVFDVLIEGASEQNDLSHSELLNQLDGAIDELALEIDGLDLGPSTGLLKVMADSRNEFATQMTDLREKVRTGSDVIGGMSIFMTDSRYLVLAPNNAEMRLGSGMPLSIGVLEIVDGDLNAPEFEPADALFPVPISPILDEDVSNRWGFLEPTNDFRKLGYSARFSEWSGPQAMQMWERLGRAPVDGVLAIDPIVLSGLLSVIGPIEFEGEQITAETVTDELLIIQYERFGNDGFEGAAFRKDRQARMAAAIVSEVGNREWDPIDMLIALKPLAEGRHILAFSPDEVMQRSWSAMGVAGKLTGDEVGVYLLNLGASKLDPFMHIDVEVQTASMPEGTDVELIVTISNEVPIDINDFAAGSYIDIGLERGDYIGRLALYAPASAAGLKFTDNPVLEVFGPDGQVWVMARRVIIPRGGQFVTSATFTVPEATETITVLPSARYPAETWRYANVTTTDAVPIEIPLGE